MSRKLFVVGAVAALGCLLSLDAASAWAASYSWTGGSGLWSTGANWNPAAPAGGPGIADIANVSGAIPHVAATTAVGRLNITSGGGLLIDPGVSLNGLGTDGSSV